MVAEKTIIKCGWIITQNEARDIFESGYIGIQNNHIFYLGKERPQTHSDEQIIEIDASDKMAIPGLINSHGHSGMTILRGMADDMPLMQWLEEKVWPMEEQLTKEDVYWAAKLSIVEMVRSGTTCFNDMYWFNQTIAKACIETGMRATVSGALIEKANGQEMLDRAKQFYKDWNNHSSGLIRGMLAPHAVYTCSPPFLEQIAEAAKELSAPIHIHLSETEKEVSDCIKTHGLTPVKLIEKLGILDSHVTAAHCIHLEEDDKEIIYDRGVIPVHNPSSNMKLASGIMEVDDLLSRNIPVALGTDSAVSNNNLSMLNEMRLAALLQKVSTGRAEALSANTAVDLATRNGARAVNREAELGQLAEGYLADIVLLNTNGAHTTPFTHPYSHLVYSMHPSDVDTVYINGKKILSDGKFTSLDEEEIKTKASESIKHIKL